MTTTHRTTETLTRRITEAPTVAPRAVPTMQDLRRRFTSLSADVALRPAGDPETQRVARQLVEIISPIVRLPAGGDATIEAPHVVTLRELGVLQRWLARATDVPTGRIIAAYDRLGDVSPTRRRHSGLASA